MNLAVIIGRAGKDAQTKNKLTTVTVATNKSYKKEDGSFESKTQWHNIIAFGYTGQKLAKVKKGDMVAVEGEMQSNTYTNKDGNEVNSFQVVASKIEVLKNNADTNKALKSGYDKDNFHTQPTFASDEIPF